MSNHYTVLCMEGVALVRGRWSWIWPISGFGPFIASKSWHPTMNVYILEISTMTNKTFAVRALEMGSSRMVLWWHTPGAHACTKDRIGERQALKVRHWSDMTKSQGMPAPRSSKTSPSEHSIHCEWVKDWSNPPVEEIGRGQESLSYHIVHRQVCYSTYYLPGSPMTSGSQNLTKHSLGANIDWHLTAGYQLDSSLVTHHMVYCSICHRMVVLSLEYRRGNWGSS
jgi:hypothetical protein